MAQRRRRRNRNLKNNKAKGDQSEEKSTGIKGVDRKKEIENLWSNIDIFYEDDSQLPEGRDKKEEPENQFWKSLWFNNNNNNNGYDDDSDMQLQEALLMSTQFYNYSIQNLEFDFAAKTRLNDVKKKGVDTSCLLVKTNKRIKSWNYMHEKGEPSCVYCTICNEPRPTVNDIMKRGPCGHIYCEDCIISYVRERIKENIIQVNCPLSKCKETLAINEYFVPHDLMDQWREAVREARVLASCDIIVCPFLDCSGYLVDDKKEFLIRACPKCWRIFCVRCRVDWHMGMECDTYQLQKKLIRPLSILILSEEDDEGTDDQQGNFKVHSLDELLRLI